MTKRKKIKPNAETQRAIEEARRGEGERFGSVEELMADLNMPLTASFKETVLNRMHRDPDFREAMVIEMSELVARIEDLETENAELRHDIARYIQHNTELLNSRE